MEKSKNVWTKSAFMPIENSRNDQIKLCSILRVTKLVI